MDEEAEVTGAKWFAAKVQPRAEVEGDGEIQQVSGGGAGQNTGNPTGPCRLNSKAFGIYSR